jgi:hypothetical protein
MKYFYRLLVLPILIISCLFIFSCNASTPLNIDVESPIDGATVRNNLLWVTGSVSDPEAELKINGTSIKLTANGRSDEFVQLQEGENPIVISAVSGKSAVEKTAKVTFIPAVAVYMGRGIPGKSAQKPDTISGFVYPAQASVKVNGEPVAVDSDGIFYAPAAKFFEGNNVFTAKATYLGNEDTSTFTVYIQNGQEIIPPGQGMADLPRIIYEDNISIKAGQSVTTNISADLRRGITAPQYVTFGFTPVAKEYSRNEISLPSGMKIDISPSRVLAYPNTEYRIKLCIQTEKSIQPGEYWMMNSMDNSMHSWTRITVTD